MGGTVHLRDQLNQVKSIKGARRFLKPKPKTKPFIFTVRTIITHEMKLSRESHMGFWESSLMQKNKGYLNYFNKESSKDISDNSKY